LILHLIICSATKIPNFKTNRTSKEDASLVDALSYVLLVGYGNTLLQGVMKVASFFFGKKVGNMNITNFEKQ